MLLVPMVTILSGCAANDRPCATQHIQTPISLTDDIVYGDLVGHYGRPLPMPADELRGECVARGKDVVMLIKAIKLKNHELKGIREIDQSKLP